MWGFLTSIHQYPYRDVQMYTTQKLSIGPDNCGSWPVEKHRLRVCSCSEVQNIPKQELRKKKVQKREMGLAFLSTQWLVPPPQSSPPLPRVHDCTLYRHSIWECRSWAGLAGPKRAWGPPIIATTFIRSYIILTLVILFHLELWEFYLCVNRWSL